LGRLREEAGRVPVSSWDGYADAVWEHLTG